MPKKRAASRTPVSRKRVEVDYEESSRSEEEPVQKPLPVSSSSMIPDSTNTLYVTDRREWRKWLEANHTKASALWLVMPKKASGKPRIPYAHAVEEALCFGWIDGVQKPYGTDATAQRFTPRKPKSNWSELNKERCRRLLADGLIMEAGLRALGDVLDRPFVFPEDILAAIRASKPAWEYYQSLPEAYRRIRVAHIETGRRQQDEFDRRLQNFIKSTAARRLIGTFKIE
jgi:uncharacterized protein YdeI (YjbR/CyaY-like superfamily)